MIYHNRFGHISTDNVQFFRALIRYGLLYIVRCSSMQKGNVQVVLSGLDIMEASPMEVHN